MNQTGLEFTYKNKSGGLLFSIIIVPFLTLLGLCGGVFLLISLVNLITEGNILSAMVWAIPGILFISIVFLIYFHVQDERKNGIAKAYFDETNKRYCVGTLKNDLGFIPYSEIAKFNYREETVQGDESSTTYHIVYFEKKDGAWWDIESCKNKQDALALLNKLEREVDLNAPEAFDLSDPAIKTDNFSFEETNSKYIFKWKDRVRFSSKLAGLIAVFSFIGTFGVILKTIEPPFFVYIIFSIVALPIFGVSVYFSFKSFTNPKEFEMVIDSFKVIQYGIKGSAKKIIREIPVSEIKYTQHSFNMINKDFFRGTEIVVLNEEFAKKLEDYKTGKLSLSDIFSAIKSIIKITSTAFKIDLTGYSITDIILFEKKMDYALRSFNDRIR